MDLEEIKGLELDLIYRNNIKIRSVMKHKHLIYSLRLIGILALIMILALVLWQFGIGRENILMLFGVGVLLVVYFTNGYQYGIIASIVSLMIFNYRYTVPVGTFLVSESDDFIILIFFLIFSLITSNLASRFQKQLEVAKRNEQLAKELSLEQERIQFAMEKEQMRSSLLRSISHDLRTPLTGISGASNLIVEAAGKLDVESIRSLARDINEQTDWLIQLVENILNMTKIESGNLLPEKKPEAAEDVINNAVTYVKSRLKQRRLLVVIPDEVIFAPMDGKMIVQVLVNLLDNAIKHTQEDGWISVNAWKEEDKVWFSVTDNGSGIQEQYLDIIFEEFVTFRPGSQDTGKGIGLGLTICKAIIAAHGGQIQGENMKDGGAKFSFWLPAGKDKNYGERSYNSDC